MLLEYNKKIEEKEGEGFLIRKYLGEVFFWREEQTRAAPLYSPEQNNDRRNDCLEKSHN